MSKKIVLIAFSTLIKEPFARCTYMLSFVSLFIFVTAKSKPFLINNMNYLEYLSNCCCLMLIVTSAFCTADNNGFLQIVFLYATYCINCLFIAKWVLSVGKLVFVKYQKILLIVSPNLYIFFLGFLQLDNEKIKRKINKSESTIIDFHGFCSQFRNFLEKLRKIKKELFYKRFNVSMKNNIFTIETFFSQKKTTKTQREKVPLVTKHTDIILVDT